jgi:acyl-CoA synthetase (AMP-forming)/AMP-acid ligase II
VCNSKNIARRLNEIAERFPHQRAVVCPAGRDAEGRVAYSQLTFQQLDRESDRLARGLQSIGVVPATRLVLMVRFGIEFVSLVFAAFKTGAVIVLIDPGMGLSNVLGCLEEVEPEGFLAIPPVHAVRLWNRRRFRHARHNLTVGRRWFWGGPTYRSLASTAWQPFEAVAMRETDPAAVIFTSGSTGPAKGVIYEHGMFNAQVDLIRDQYAIEPGGVDLSGFPLFGLFNAAMGTTTVIPAMNPSKPAKANPARIVEAIEDQTVSQSFGSPALWERVTRHCEDRQIHLTSLRRVFSAGAAVPVSVLERLQRVLAAERNCPSADCPSADGGELDLPHTDAIVEIHTPYGATEALPVSTISAREIVEQTAQRTRTGAGTCVGQPFPGVGIKIIEITDAPIPTISAAREMPTGQIGEVIVQGPSVTRRYLRRPDADAAAKIADPPESGGPYDPTPFWHRMGDVGYLDDQGRLWYCGRKSHIVTTPKGPLFTEPCEAIFNEHPRVFRSALVGVGRRGEQIPAIVVEPQKGEFPLWSADRQKFSSELRDLAAGNPLTLDVHTILFHRSLPVDVRHNSKINRERLAVWAANGM